MKKISVKKGEILQRKGELNSKVYKVRSGLLRSYS
ncbi:MAG: CRP-like cAMP-binding protein, partial [Flavobacteriales bacterium]